MPPFLSEMLAKNPNIFFPTNGSGEHWDCAGGAPPAPPPRDEGSADQVPVHQGDDTLGLEPASRPQEAAWRSAVSAGTDTLLQ